MNVTPDNKVFTSASAPEALHTPATNVEVTEPEDAVFNVPAPTTDSVNVAVTASPSTSVITMSVRLSAASSV